MGGAVTEVLLMLRVCHCNGILMLKDFLTFSISSHLYKHFSIMFVFTFVTFLFVGTTATGNSPCQTRLSEDTFEWLKTVQFIVWPIKCLEINWRPIALHDIFVQKALGAWAGFINQQLIYESPYTAMDQKYIVLPQKEINEQLGPVIVWVQSGHPLIPKWIDHIILRRVNIGVYEWIKITQPTMRDAREPLELRPFYHSCPFWRARFDGRRLTEMCSVFAEQQIQYLLRRVSEGIQKIHEDFEKHQRNPNRLRYDIEDLDLMVLKDDLDRTIDDLQQIKRRKREMQLFLAMWFHLLYVMS